MKSQGEIEAALCEGVSRFQLESIGRGPKDILCHLLGSLVVVRLQGVLTAAERRLLGLHEAAPSDGQATANGSEAGDGRLLVKQLRDRVVANGRKRLGQLVEDAVGVPLVSVHHDISTITGEEVLVFSLSAAPSCRPKRA